MLIAAKVGVAGSDGHEEEDVNEDHHRRYVQDCVSFTAKTHAHALSPTANVAISSTA
jgi:hypothetical protein